MKATGIVRRIDDLGRVVIPKEIRKTLRIREGEPLEIFIGTDGEIILKKYSPLQEQKAFLESYGKYLAKAARCPVCITDKEQVMTAAGSGKRKLEGVELTKEFIERLELRKLFLEKNNGQAHTPIMQVPDEEWSEVLVSPIISEGDVLGAVLFLAWKGEEKGMEMKELKTKERKGMFNETAMRLAECASAFLGEQMSY